MMVSIEPVDLQDAVDRRARHGARRWRPRPTFGFRVVEPGRRHGRRRRHARRGGRHPVWVLADKRAHAPGARQPPQQRGQVQPHRRQRHGQLGAATTSAAAVRIEDSGLGMTSEKLERLFEPFNRLGAEKSNIEGTGIGLVLSRRLVELMEGDLLISSTLGLGTVATLRPAGRPKRRRRGRAPQSPPSQHGSLGGSLRVLYAEDDEVNVELIRQVVALRPTVDLSVATNGARALEMARRDPPDLMLVDMNLGDMTGIELAQRAAGEPADGRPPAGRAVGRRVARADQRDARRGLRELPDQAGRLPQVPRRARQPLEGRGLILASLRFALAKRSAQRSSSASPRHDRHSARS